MLLIAAGSLWLFLAAVPVFADGGPHVAAVNSGVNGISADSCAGCHRAHRAQGEFLLIAESGTALCLTCHGATGLGSAVDVENGVQYTLGTTDTRGSTVLGYTRGGGFVNARIGSGEAVRIGYTSTHGISQNAKVPVRTAGSQAVTSAHLPNAGGVVGAANGIAWGNGPNTENPYAGPFVALECGTCHNPHGNDQYRILNPIPDPAETGTDSFVAAGTEVTVDDAALPPAGDTRNYTIIQTNGGTGTLLASQVTALALPATAGDYFRRKVPWNGTSGTSNDAPNGLSATFTVQISTWCTTCHSRYLSQGWATKEADAIFTYRHTATNTSRNCITCHVSHGSNAQMTGTYSANMENPGGIAAPVGDSRLLKADNRGTCQLCHDPTGTIVAGQQVGPTPVPVLP
ncbi:MAG: cytochrome c3 family protein [Candidatus Limnocylindrales bacterium]